MPDQITPDPTSTRRKRQLACKISRPERCLRRVSTLPEPLRPTWSSSQISLCLMIQATQSTGHVDDTSPDGCSILPRFSGRSVRSRLVQDHEVCTRPSALVPLCRGASHLLLPSAASPWLRYVSPDARRIFQKICPFTCEQTFDAEDRGASSFYSYRRHSYRA